MLKGGLPMLRGSVLLVIFLAAGIASGQVAPAFDAVVIRPARVDETGRHWNRDNNMTAIGNYPLKELILRAYNLKAASQVVGAPDWAEKDRYDITAKVTPDDLKRMDALPPREGMEAYRTMLRGLLQERFGLQVEVSKQTMPRFELERVSAAAMGPGLKVTPAGPDGRAVGGRNTSRNSGIGKVTMTVSGVEMADVADLLSGMNEVGQRVVVDRTGLAGFYNFRLEYAPDSGMGVAPEATLPGLLDAMREQLGLKLVKDEGDVPVVVVKTASRPETE